MNKKIFTLALLVILVSSIGLWLWRGQDKLPVLSEPIWGLLNAPFKDQHANNVDLSHSQQGKPVLVSFMFTRCPGPCPVLNGVVAKALADHSELRAVSITSDPGYDTPEVLLEYSKRFGPVSERWMFLNTTRTETLRIGQAVFKLPAGETPDLHSTRIVLLDEKGRIRGYFSSNDPADVQRLRDAIRDL